MTVPAPKLGRYVPGPWALLCGAGSWLLADVAGESDRLDALWSLIGGAAGLDELLRALSEGDFGFALLHRDATTHRAVLRGAGSVSYGGGETRSVLVAPEVGPKWAEFPFAELPAGVRLEIQDAAIASTWLPISGGVTLAAGVEIGAAENVSPLPVPLDPELAQVPSLADDDESTPSTQYDFLFEATQRDLPSEPPSAAKPETELEPEPEPEPQAVAEPDPSATLFGEPPAKIDNADPAPSLIASVPGVAGAPEIRAPDERTTAPIEREFVSSDIDDRTISRAELAAAARSSGPVVKAVPCPGGHPNPPQSSTCRICGAALPATTPVTVPRPILGTLRLSTGAAIPLDRGAIFGRNPDVGAAGNGERPHVVQVPSPDKDISRNHVEVKLDGWHVLVSDLGSTNGTIVTLPGQPPQRLHPNEAMPITPGTLVNLADEVSFRYEVGAP